MILASVDPAGGGENEWGFCACNYDVIHNLQVIIQTDAVVIPFPSPSKIGDA